MGKQNSRTVTLVKDGVEHEFVKSSMPVWVARGWKQTSDSEKQSEEALQAEVEAAKRQNEIDKKQAEAEKALLDENMAAAKAMNQATGNNSQTDTK